MKQKTIVVGLAALAVVLATSFALDAAPRKKGVVQRSEPATAQHRQMRKSRTYADQCLDSFILPRGWPCSF